MSERKECQGCPQEHELVCCSSRPTGVLSTAFNYFVKPKVLQAARADDLAIADEIQRKCGQGTLVVAGMTGNC